jgi:hypothetical protein
MVERPDILVWDLTISWHNRLTLCLGIDHFMKKQIDTMSGAWPFHDITDSHYVWGLTISWYGQISDIVSVCFVMKWSSPRHSISVFCHEMVKPQTSDTMSEVWPFHDNTDWYYVWGLTISWQNRLILFLGLDHFMTKQIDTMSGPRPFHAKTNWYYV